MTQNKDTAQSALVRKKVITVLNELQVHDEVSVDTINAAVFGLVTRSMQQRMGQEKAREYLESAMDNVWGKKKWWKR